MRSVFVGLAAVWMSSAAWASVAPPPPEPEPEPTESASSSSDATGAFVLLALIGMVVASGVASTGARSKSTTEMVPGDVDDSSGF